ncbi:hypothetical protein NDU88_001678 [Pleurodeles waltl]|uniref:Uncharacterized protein n=1 Tax=Pleurodeles waltl TaxID=8319 RepID=A0AAV7WPC3_PLEWA|nr:hypothetical protein NDU88_001678 [Pleurodeles waltl]
MGLGYVCLSLIADDRRVAVIDGGIDEKVAAVDGSIDEENAGNRSIVDRGVVGGIVCGAVVVRSIDEKVKGRVVDDEWRPGDEMGSPVDKDESIIDDDPEASAVDIEVVTMVDVTDDKVVDEKTTMVPPTAQILAS